jgi:uncharacterized protein (UPF0276 family)
LCWTGVAGLNTHDLLPVPRTPAALDHIVERVRQVQDYLGSPLLLENPSTYGDIVGSTIPEHDFLSEIAERADAGILLDVNNVYVSAHNNGFDPWEYLSAIPYDRVVQLHVAGHTRHERHIVDSHIGPVPDVVWTLFREAQRRAGGASVLLEWDAEIPPFEVVHEEALRANAFARATLEKVA